MPQSHSSVRKHTNTGCMFQQWWYHPLKADFFYIKLSCDITVGYYSRDKAKFFQWTLVSQFPKQRVTSKYSEYILKKKASLPVIPLPGKCLKHTHAHIRHIAAGARGFFFWYNFSKTCWKMPSSLIPTFAADLSPFKASVTCRCQRLLFNVTLLV